MREERLPWLIMGVAIVSWTAADIIWTVALRRATQRRPIPSIADALWLAWYPASSRRADAARALAPARRPGEPLARRPDRRRWRDGARRRPRLRPGRPRWQRRRPSRRRGHQPRLPARRPAAAGHDRRDLRADELAARPGLDRCSGSAWPSTRSATPSTSSRPPRAPARRAPGSNALWPASSLLVGLAAWQPIRRASAAQGSQPAGGDRAGRVRGRRGRAAGLRPLLQPQRADGGPRRRDPAAGAGAHGPRVRREPARAGAQPPGGAHRPADRPAQPPQPDGRPRGAAAGGDARASRARWSLFDLDGFKEYNDAFGHPAGDAAARAAGRAARRRRARPRARLPARRRRVLRRARTPARPAWTCSSTPASRALRRARRGLRGDHLARRRRGADGGRPTRPTRCSWPTGACTPARASAACRPAASRATCCCAACPSASPTCTCTCAAPPTWRCAVGRELGMARRGARRRRARGRAARRRQDRHPRRDPGQARPARRRPSGRSCAATRSSASASCWRRRRCAASAELVRSSHERWDGDGYPDGLAGEEIPLGARVVAVCDAFDAMTTDRPYRHRVGRAGGAGGAAALRRHAVRPARSWTPSRGCWSAR